MQGKKTYLVKSFLIFFLFFFNSFLFSAEWEIEKQEDGITVSLRDVKGSKYREFKAQMTVPASLSAVVAVLDDTPSYTKWIYQCVKASLLKKEQNNERDVRYTHTELDFSMIASKRDLITLSVLTQDKNTKVVHVSLLAASSYLPVSKEMVRIQKLNGFWQIKPIANNMVEVTYQAHLDPGGNIFSWVANSAFVDIGFETLKNMRELIKIQKYKNAKFDHIKEP